MGADDDVDASLGQITDHGLLFRGLSKAAQMFDSDGIIRHAFAEIVEMLLSEDRRGHEHRDLVSAHHRLECRSNRNLSLPEANVPADETVHGERALHVGFRFVNGFQLIARLLVQKRILKLPLPFGIGQM